MAYSQALTHAALWVQAKRGGNASPPPTVNAPPVPRVPEKEYVENLLETARLAQTHNASTVIIGAVYRDREHDAKEANLIAHYRESLRDACEQARVPYLEIPELTEANYPANQNLFGEPIHPNHEGHRLMATALLRFFAAHDMLKGLNVPPGL
jgi:lysophospholipase L1-like esterase